MLQNLELCAGRLFVNTGRRWGLISLSGSAEASVNSLNFQFNKVLVTFGVFVVDIFIAQRSESKKSLIE